MSTIVPKEYSQDFYESITTDSLPSAKAVVPVISSIINFKSVLDLGCGGGAWLREFANFGYTDILGLDGEFVTRDQLIIPEANFQVHDLRKPVSLDRRFDLAISLEVAEHLPESCADGFVDSLVQHAHVILFSAAIPGQSGTKHINLQWPKYWREKFLKRGYRRVDAIRPLIWSDRNVAWWYKQNLFVYTDEQGIASFKKPTAFDEDPNALTLVHEKILAENLADNQGVAAAMGHALRAVGRAVKRRVGKLW